MAWCATTALAGAVPWLSARGARGRFGGVGAGAGCCVFPVSPFPPRVSWAVCGGPSRPGVPYPRSRVRHSMRSVRSAGSVRLPFWYSPRVLCVCVRSRSRGVRAPPPPCTGAVTRVVCPPGPPVYMDSRTAARAPRPGRPLGREALGAPRGPSNRPPRHRGRLVQPRAAPPVPVQSGSADRPQSCVGLGHPLPMAVVGSLRHVGRPGGGVSRPATPPVGSQSGSPSLPTRAWSTRQHTAPRARTAPHAHHHTPSDQGTLVSCPG